VLTSLALVVLAAVIHATWNLLAKRSARAGMPFVFAYNLFSAAGYAPVVAWLALRGEISWSAPALACMIASALIHLAYSLCLQRGYQVADLSVIYPVARGTGPLLSSLCAFVLFGERVTALGLAGLAAVVGGILLIATQGRLTAFRTPGGHAGLRWGTTTGGLIASYTVVDAFGVKQLGVVPVALDWFSNLVRFILLAPVIARDFAGARARMRGHWGSAAAVGLLSPLSYILVLEALRSGAPLSLVAPAREMSMMVAALLGLVVLREAVGPWRVAGCAILVSGVVMLAIR
jgi:drug/metabolite transporter (DMT)-like permease